MEKINFKKRAFISVFCLVAGIISCKAQQTGTGISDTSLPFLKGEKVTSANFTGTVWLNNLIQADSSNQNAVGNVTFDPGARTKWHVHPGGQILLVTDGVGYYQEKGKTKEILRKGDVKKCPPNIPHWHGASSDSAFVQLAITGREKGETIWLEPVNEEQYNSKVAKN
jgi:quercetin dioxygenase-like cupin family protein